MFCLGIESSCDDTSLALVQDGTLIHQVSSSQEELHSLFGGVVPEIASREHARLIAPLYDKLFCDANQDPNAVDVVAVARGPGLLGSLLVGLAFAKAFALGKNVRLIGVNHLHAHLLAVGLEQKLYFPALGVLVSGGHTYLYRMENPISMLVLGKTLDDAAGEAFDKAGKMLGLPYPAGRLMDELANQGNPLTTLFPRPYLDNETLDFSFSGLKTAMYSYLSTFGKKSAHWDALSGEITVHHGNDTKISLADVCASYRLAVVETLAAKTRKAMEATGMDDILALVLAGGVAANTLLREKIRHLAVLSGKRFLVPSPSLCTDNGAMIAYTGWLLAKHGYGHALDLKAISRGHPVPDDMIRIEV
jgi:N6-L-threonylcarbamoyladenine synthase